MKHWHFFSFSWQFADTINYFFSFVKKRLFLGLCHSNTLCSEFLIKNVNFNNGHKINWYCFLDDSVVSTKHQFTFSYSFFQVIKLLLMIIIAFLLSWGPKLTLNILQKLQLSFLYDKSAYAIKVRQTYSNKNILISKLLKCNIR